MERERERESFALLSSISTASPYRPNLIHLCRPTGVLARNFVPTDFVEEQFRFRTKRRKESSSSFLLQFSSFFYFEEREKREKGRRYKFAKHSRARERERKKEERWSKANLERSSRGGKGKKRIKREGEGCRGRWFRQSL